MLNRLNQISKCTENYTFISDDLVNYCKAGSTRNNLALLLKYYSHGLRRAVNSVPDNDIYSDIKNDTKARLNLIDTNLIVCGIELPDLPQRDGVNFKIPNASMIELLIKSRFENIEIPQFYTLSEPALL
jgi:hypothetical protein